MAVSHLLPCLKPALWAQAFRALFGLSMARLLGPQWALPRALNGPFLGLAMGLL